MMAHYVMVGEGKYPIMPIKTSPREAGWKLGQLITHTVTQPVTYILDYEYGGNPKAMYQAEAIPVMRDDIIAVLTKLGVDNIQYFDAVLINESSGERYTDYKSFNIVGAVAAADMGQSVLMGTSTSTIGDVDFESLVLDEAKAAGHLLFRLAECVSAIIVDEPVKHALESAGIPGLFFYSSGEWSG